MFAAARGCGVKPKIKAQYYVLPWCLLKSGGPWLAPVDKGLWTNNPPYQGDQAQVLLIPK